MATTFPWGWGRWRPRRIYGAEGQNLLQKVKSQLGVLYCLGMSSVSPPSPAHIPPPLDFDLIHLLS